MDTADVVYLYVWTGDAKNARTLVTNHFRGANIIEFPHHEFRSSSIAGRLRTLHGFKGQALVFYFRSLADSKYIQILKCIHLLHRCKQTVLLDEGGSRETIRSATLLRLVPTLLWRASQDVVTLVFWFCYLEIWTRRTEPVPFQAERGNPEVAYLIPHSQRMGNSGGAVSHIRGFLGGLKVIGKTCRVFSAAPLAQDAFANEIISPQSRRFLFWEAPALAYNLRYARGVQKHLADQSPRFLYQRHCRLSVTGALLSRRLGVPLILEYNGSEVWIADHWDPTFFRRWIELCEEVTLGSASRIVVVSDVLKAELTERGIPADRILVNPNAVDPDYFYPGRGREQGRRDLSIEPPEVLVGFVGTFSLWHGIEVLQQAITRLLSDSTGRGLRFVLIGDGLLHAQMRSYLAPYEAAGKVIFTGTLPREKVVEYLDASDILVSPHIPMPDGSRFFGSPTKLFEYMAMGKGIVASRLDQLADVLEHERTALLVTPGSVEELSDAILELVSDPQKRQSLGAAARLTAVECHSWSQNARRALNSAVTTPIARRNGIDDRG